MNQEKTQARISWLLDELKPVSEHEDYGASPSIYTPDTDIIYLDIMPYAPSEWADIAFEFAHKDGMKYDRDSSAYGIDGQPRVSFSGLVWVRFLGDFKDGANVGYNIWSDLWTPEQAENQLARYYRLFQERDGLNPVEVFREYLEI